MSEYSADRVHRTAVARWGKTTVKTRLFRKVRVDFESGCWMWTASKDRRGYGQIYMGPRPIKAHIVMFKIYGGTVPVGLTLDHLCRITSCVNPEHLEPTTRGENTRRQFAAIGNHNAAKTACPGGHPYTDQNTKGGSNGAGRACRACANENSRRYRVRKKAVSA